MAADTIKEELPEFFIEGQLTEVVLGQGGYGYVKKIIVDETECAAKIIYGAIMFGSNVGNQHIKELSLQSNLRHPHIVQFLGIWPLPGSSLPALVTELMDTSLHKFLVDPAMKDQVQISYKKSILEDVTKGLVYLHKKGIVHRDLTANNVLLTSSLVAKIADLGNSRFLPKEEFAKLTSRPGTVVYMPPEANTNDYSHKLDIFSFGHLTLFTMIQTFPYDLLLPNYQDPDVPTESLKPRNEVARREKYFKIMTEKLPTEVHDAFEHLTKKCLAYIPDDRPEAIEILHRLRQIQVGGRNEGMNCIEIDLFTKQRNEEEKQQIRNDYEATIQTMQHAIEQKDREIHDLQERLRRAPEAPDLATVGLIQNGVPNLVAQPANLGNIPDPPADLAPEAEPQPRITVVPEQQTAPPISMSNYPHAVVYNNHIYLGGGFTKSADVATLLEYDPQRDQWNTSVAHQCPTKYFGMAVVKNKLLIIGGTDISSKTKRGLVYSLDFESKKWNRFQCLSMLVYRSTPSVVSCGDKWLIAIGGEDKDGQVLSSVERLDVESPEGNCYWCSCAALPVKSAHFTSAIVGDMLFTFGTTTYGATMSVGMPSNSVFFAPLDKLLSSNDKTESGSVWHQIRHLPLKASTAVSFNGSLFALGGTEKGYGDASTSIFKLKCDQAPDNESEWIKVGDLPIPLCQCASTQNGDSIFVHGRRVKAPDVCVYTLTVDVNE